MKTRQTIVAATDFSAAATLAVERAALLAREWDCPLNLLHVFNPFSWTNATHLLPDILLGRNPAAQYQTNLARLRDEIAGRAGPIAITISQADGRASAAIAGHADAVNAGLIVIGIRGEGIVHELALGGTAVKVLRRSPCPVLAVRGSSPAPYRRVVIATDFSATATRALRVALDLFPAAEHIAIHASQVPYEGRMRLAGASTEDIGRYRASELATAQSQMDAYLTHADYEAASSIRRVIRHGYPAAVLLDELHRTPCDLLVLGRHGQSVLDEHLLGSITLNLLHHAPCDVLLVP
jgi:nucleotide-binding universal stress UspA family protein